ncbi:tape measure domain-containing protein [Lachnotalea glycerini]|uniref:Tape measure domain-containing protein n=1 Tax=Lachnotalea glycerini TaxID=1763509 RepID=A0A318EGK3_9FIRM|nr:tape measure protein [Lachnotalea glycerini]PXV85087.1 tape measure domain-containing protein [Lachnotalea glycerini]
MAGIHTSVNVNDGLSAAFRTMTQSINVCLSSFIEMQEAAGQGVNTASIQAARSALNDVDITAGQVADEIAEARNRQQQFNNEVTRGNSAMSGLVGKAIGLVGAYASLQGIKGLAAISDTMTQTTARLDLMNDDLQTTAELQQKIFQSAQDSRAAYTDMASTISKLGLLASKAFSSNDEIIEFAELMNKGFVVGGSSATEQASAMYQLTQAMAAGKLQGDEYRSIIENSPLLAKSIEDYMINVKGAQGSMKDWASDGKLTADVIKAALFGASSEINEAFETMPMTWSQVATSIKNQALVAFQPILTKVNEIANSDKLQSFSNGIVNSLYALASVASGVFDVLVTVGSFLYDNWDMISPVIYGVATAMIFYTGIIIAHNVVLGIKNTLTAIAALRDSVYAAKIMLATGATFAQTAAQVGLNAALLACPLTWIILLIIAVIAVIYLVVAAINHFAGTSYSATGVIIGAFAVLGAFIWNTVVGVLNAIIQFLWSSFVEPFISIIEWVLNAANGGFNSFGDAVANLIGQIISWFLSLGKVVTKIIDAIFGTDWTSGLSSLQNSVLAWGKNESAITINRDAPTINSRIGYGDAWDTGYQFGKGIDDKVSGMFSSDAAAGTQGSILDSLGNIDTNTASGAESTDKIADSLEITDEDLKYLRDIAEREIIDRTVFQSLTVDMGGVSNTVNNMADLDGIGDYLGDVIIQTASASMEG